MPNDPYAGLNPEFSARLRAFVADSGGKVSLGSGFRSYGEQAQLYADYKAGKAGQARAAPPGRSNHNFGLADDLKFAGDAGRQWAHANAARYGLVFPMGDEPWHVEPARDGSMQAAFQSATNGGAMGSDMSVFDSTAKPQDDLSHRLRSIMAIITGTPQAELPAVDSGIRTETETVPGQTSTVNRQVPGNPRPTRNPDLGAPVPVQGGKFQPSVERWRPIAMQALAYAGEDPSLIDLLLRRMDQESDGNPTIVNRTDSNARKGTPSIGLMQTIGPTFNQYAGELRDRGITDPFANIVASLRYARSRYGSVAKAYSRAGGY